MGAKSNSKRSIEPVYQEIGRVIREKRKAIGFNLKDMADLCELTRTSICNIESGRQRIHCHQFLLICAMMQLSPLDILRQGEVNLWISAELLIARDKIRARRQNVLEKAKALAERGL